MIDRVYKVGIAEIGFLIFDVKEKWYSKGIIYVLKFMILFFLSEN